MKVHVIACSLVLAAGFAQAEPASEKAKALYGDATKALYKCGSTYAWSAAKTSASATEIAIGARSACAQELDDLIATMTAWHGTLAIERGKRSQAALDRMSAAEAAKVPGTFRDFVVSEVIAARLDEKDKP